MKSFLFIFRIINFTDKNKIAYFRKKIELIKYPDLFKEEIIK